MNAFKIKWTARTLVFKQAETKQHGVSRSNFLLHATFANVCYF